MREPVVEEAGWALACSVAAVFWLSVSARMVVLLWEGCCGRRVFRLPHQRRESSIRKPVPTVYLIWRCMMRLRWSILADVASLIAV